METTRRSLLAGLGALLAAPAIVRATSLMPVKVLTPTKPDLSGVGGSIPPQLPDWIPCDGRSLLAKNYEELFAKIGTYYGGDGERFNVPDLGVYPFDASVIRHEIAARDIHHSIPGTEATHVIPTGYLISRIARPNA
jgi:hypothetical protein